MRGYAYNHIRRHGYQPPIYKSDMPYILKQSLIESRRGLNPGPSNLESPALPSELLCYCGPDIDRLVKNL